MCRTSLLSSGRETEPSLLASAAVNIAGPDPPRPPPRPAWRRAGALPRGACP